MSVATVLTDRFDRALLYATHVHGGQVRKGTTIPYVAHLLAVAATVLEYGGSEDMAIGYLVGRKIRSIPGTKIVFTGIKKMRLRRNHRERGGNQSVIR